MKWKPWNRWYWMPMGVLVLGMSSIAMLIWIDRINEKQRRNFDLCDATMDIQIKTAVSHLWLHEAIAGDDTVDVEKVKENLDMAMSLAEAILKGGKSEHGLPLQSVKDPKLRKRVEEIKSLLIKFETIVLENIQDPKSIRIGSALDRDLDDIFGEIQAKANALEIIVERDQLRDRGEWKRLNVGVLLAWAGVLFISISYLWAHEVRRRTAEEALQKANEQLQSQAEELRKYQDHLTDLVEGRTAELAFAVRTLEGEIAERKQAEKSLFESENKCRVLVDYLPQKIYLKDQNSVYVYCNDNFAHDLNIKTDEIIGKTDYDLFSKEIAENNIAEDKEIIKSGKAIDVEERHIRQGQEVVIHKFKMHTRNEISGVNGILGILWDVTERVRLEAVAEAVTTMNNIGSIFAGIRHEIGNPINSAKMTLSVLKSKISTYSREVIEEYIERALGEISGVEYLLKTLKSFNMYETLGPQNVELKPFMDKFLSFLADDLGKKGITIESSFQPEAQWGYADPRALQQVMLNIMSNASDAMEGRDSPRIIVEVSKVDYIIRIKVTDNGCGISEEQQKRLFTPFFTSKPSGTGLGLVIAKKLLSKMNGTIEITSQRDEGTTVEILIQEGRDEH